MKSSINSTSAKPAAALLAVLASVYGCASTPPSSLVQARNQYQTAAQDPHIRNYAPVALHDAEQALQRAERALDTDQDSVPHLAYVAGQRVEIARAQAQKAMATERIEQLAQQRDEVLLQARGQQAQQARQQALQARQHAQQLEQELQDLKAQQTERGTEIVLQDVLFETGRAELKPGALLNLQPLIDFLKANPGRNLLIEGHTDSVGTEEYNRELSRARASAVRDFFVAQGIGPERVTIQGYGEQYPVASNDNAAGRQQNRRVNLVILKDGQDARRVMR